MNELGCSQAGAVVLRFHFIKFGCTALGCCHDERYFLMKKDYSQFLPHFPKPSTDKNAHNLLEKLGWQAFFLQQTTLDEVNQLLPVRVMEVHRTHLQVKGEAIDQLIDKKPDITVGDWCLFDPQSQKIKRRLARKSLFQRRAPGKDRQVQLIAANVDTVFIVSSCNHDFNIARLERYIALAFEAEVIPVIVLTKTDLCDDVDSYIQQASRLSGKVMVIALNALHDNVAEHLKDWCKPGQTVAFLGSSGVGKSTLVNALGADCEIKTQSIREDDSKGRHTTTSRQLYLLEAGYMVLDTPGMREIQLTQVKDGISTLFDDLDSLAKSCRFNNCQHESEPGCAIKAALEAGEIEEDRLLRWQKLAREEAFNTASLAQRRAKDKAFGKMVRDVMKHKHKK